MQPVNKKNPRNIRLYDLVAFATKSDPERIKCIMQVEYTRSKRPYYGTQLFGTQYHPETWETMSFSINAMSKQLLINKEIPQVYRDKLLELKAEEMNRYVDEYEHALSLYHQFKDQHAVSIYYCSSSYYVRLNGDGQQPIYELSRKAKELLDAAGWLCENSLFSAKGRCSYNFREPFAKEPTFVVNGINPNTQRFPYKEAGHLIIEQYPHIKQKHTLPILKG